MLRLSSYYLGTIAVSRQIHFVPYLSFPPNQLDTGDATTDHRPRTDLLPMRPAAGGGHFVCHPITILLYPCPSSKRSLLCGRHLVKVNSSPFAIETTHLGSVHISICRIDTSPCSSFISGCRPHFDIRCNRIADINHFKLYSGHFRLTSQQF